MTRNLPPRDQIGPDTPLRLDECNHRLPGETGLKTMATDQPIPAPPTDLRLCGEWLRLEGELKAWIEGGRKP